jgi:hypothetical protein
MRWAAFALGAIVIAACSAPPDDPRTVSVGPDRASFDAVSNFLDRRCGSLDCHGVRYRNLRVWGRDGMRLDPADSPGGNVTTPGEIDATYRSVVRLEPELMNAVVADHGAHPERLTLLRKARGTEHHDGKALFIIGDDQDRCVTSWLSSATDTAACTRALAVPFGTSTPSP